MRGGSAFRLAPLRLFAAGVATAGLLSGVGAGADEGDPARSAAEQARRPDGRHPAPAAAAAEAAGAEERGTHGAPQSGERRTVRMLAERFRFTPSEIRVPRGVTLELRIRSDDTMHGFRIVGRNVNLAVPKRRQGEAVVVFEADEAGRYTFECSRLCGAGHNFMRGQIVVVEPEAAGDGSRGPQRGLRHRACGNAPADGRRAARPTGTTRTTGTTRMTEHPDAP